MNLVHAIHRPAGILPWPATVVLASLTAATPAALSAPRPRPPGWNKHALSAEIPRRGMTSAPQLRPRTVQLCIHCRQNPAGFGVSHTSNQTVRRPWCLSCCQGLDQSRYHMIPFDGHHGAGRFQ